MDTTIGTLNDKDIINLCSKNKLITENFLRKNVKQACYELRASNIFYDISDSHKKNTVNTGEYIIIKPKQIVVIITLEELSLPNDILGKILTKGKLFSVGLLPVNTYADPGFQGKLGIVFSNLSNNYLKIYPEEAIAKIEFNKLEHPVEKAYSGQHGYETGIWPIPTDLIMTIEEIKNDKRIKDFSKEIELSHGKSISNVITRLHKYERKFLLVSIAYLVFTLILIAIFQGTDWISTITTIVLGVIVNIIYGVTATFLTNIRS
ncbi:hypothetical protein PGC35_19380 [Psychrobacillus sp. PGGUH221]|uniref:dCTP deaminase domain-containing protein n=1 Tax=Psychrobacillus sp. PGGUH221 TaxID=3020058 RepID=UPI0035C67232